MLENPLIQRYRKSLIRPKQFWVYQVVYACIVGLIMLISYLIYYQPPKDGREFFSSTYYQFLTFQILILWFWGGYNSGSAIRNELIRKTYDFFKLLPMTAHQKAAGILIGRNLVMLLFACYNFIFLVIFGVLGGLNSGLQGQIFFVILSLALLFNTLALLSAMRVDGKNMQTSATPLILLGLICTPFVIGIAASLSESGIFNLSIRFYALSVPALLMIAFVALYFCCWSFIGIIRKLTSEREPLFTYFGSMSFLVGYGLLTCGLFWVYLLEKKMMTLYFLWLVLLIPVLLIPFGAVKTCDVYLERFRSSKRGLSTGKMHWRLFTNSNLFLCLSLLVIWGLFSAGMGLSVDSLFIPSIIVLLSFCLFLSLLFEMHTVYQPLYGKIKLLLGFIALLYAFLPLILAPILTNDGVLQYSPLGYVFYLFEKADVGQKVDFASSVFIMNLVLCTVPIGLIWQRYRQILRARRRIWEKELTIEY